MTRTLTGCMVFALFSGVVCAQEPAPGFTFALLARLPDAHGNAVCAPLSLRAALAMAAAGARGRTALELERVIGSADAAVAGELKLVGELASSRTVTLAAANALWGQAGRPFSRGFAETCARQFGAGLELVDFGRSPERARRRINAWTAERTKGLVRDLIGAGTFSGRTRLVLTNAIYFRGAWMDPFDASLTRPGRFRLSSGRTVRVPLMSRKGVYALAEAEEAAALELPYRGGDLALWIVLPRDPAGLDALERKLTETALRALCERASTSTVTVTLPRFHVESNVRLAAALKAMGAPTAFSDAADFGGMLTEPVKLDDVVHAASIDVNEQGTEAAAASGATVILKGLAQPRTFVADRPFLFFLVAREKGTILFAGRVANPRR